jgi:acyl-CoA thioester hydrolase
MRDRFRTWITLDVRWGDMDAYRHVNNAAYFTYCESARIRYFDVLGLDSLRESESHGPAVVTATCNFHRQVHYPATLDVGVRTIKLGHTSFTLDYVLLRREDDAVVADGSSVVVWVDYDEGKSIPVPVRLKARIREIEPDPG